VCGQMLGARDSKISEMYAAVYSDISDDDFLPSAQVPRSPRGDSSTPTESEDDGWGDLLQPALPPELTDEGHVEDLGLQDKNTQVSPYSCRT